MILIVDARIVFLVELPVGWCVKLAADEGMETTFKYIRYVTENVISKFDFGDA